MSDVEPRLPGEVREGVRTGILSAIAQDVELRGGRTAGRLVFAGVVGVAGAIGAMLIVSNHPFDHHPHWHEIVFSAIWAGLLVVSLALVMLHVQTPRLPIARAAAFGLVGLGIAGLCSLACPDMHIMEWWLETKPGSAIAKGTSTWASALCFGFATVFAIALVSAVLLRGHMPPGTARAIAALLLALLLGPGIIVESVGFPLSIFAAWIAGSAAGAYGGVEGAALFTSALSRGPRTP